MSPLNMLLIGAVIVIGGVLVYNKMKEPRSLDDRMNGAAEQLQQGNFGKAASELGDQTNGDKAKSTVKDLINNP